MDYCWFVPFPLHRIALVPRQVWNSVLRLPALDWRSLRTGPVIVNILAQAVAFPDYNVYLEGTLSVLASGIDGFVLITPHVCVF